MKNKKKCRINDSRFSVRFCTVMRYYGIVTVGQAFTLLDRMNHPNKKLAFGTSYIRIYKLQKELNEFLND